MTFNEWIKVAHPLARPTDPLWSICKNAWNAAIAAADSAAESAEPPAYHGDTSQECAERVRGLLA